MDDRVLHVVLKKQLRDDGSLFCTVWLLQREASQVYCVCGSLEAAAWPRHVDCLPTASFSLVV